MANRSRRKRRSAWASITEVRAGEVYRIRFWGKGTDGQYRRRSCTVRGSRLEAERKRSELMLLHSDDAPCPTVGEVWERWALPDLKRRVDSGDASAGTLRQYLCAWGKHVQPTWGAVQCDAVRPLSVQQWLYGLPLNAAKQGISLLRIVLDYATRYELVPHNVARERYLMPSKSTIDTMDAGIWSLDELRRTWAVVRGTWMESAYLLCGFGGLRVGEALGVRCSDIDEATVDGVRMAVVTVHQQVTETGLTDVLKTPQSRRVVVIAGSAGVRLLELSQTESVYMSGDGMGGPSTRARLTKAWRRLDMPDELRHPLRNLRNSWQTWMRWSMRVPVWCIEPMMGHKVAGVTGEHYDRPQRELFCEVIADAYSARPYDAEWGR